MMKKAERLACWGARDELWRCWDKLGYLTPQCQAARDQYEVECPATWVTHFDRKFQYEKWKKKRRDSDAKVEAGQKPAK